MIDAYKTDKFPTIGFRPNWIDPAISKFLEHATRNATMLEWGSGMSTVYLAQYVKHIYAVEHNHLWYTKVKKWTEHLPNVTILYRPYPPPVSYINAPLELNMRFEIIEIDGRLRNQCFMLAQHLLLENGVLIFDDTNETLYTQSLDIMKRNPRHMFFQGRPGGKATSIIHNVNPKSY